MQDADKRAGAGGQWRSGTEPGRSSAALVVVGGGVMGLWAALKAARRGIQTVLVETDAPGAGASGGLLGALMPHAPDRWDEKKQFQFEALLSLEAEVALLAAETGMDCGYRRVGRLMPLPKPHLREIALSQRQDAAAQWRSGERHFDWRVIDHSPFASWPADECAGAGLVHETFSARLSPRRLNAALTAGLRQAGNVTVITGVGVARIDPQAGRLLLSNGEAITFGHAIIAAGEGSFPLLEAISPGLRRPLGRAVKGQAALLAGDADPAMPLIFLNGVYVIAHDDGHVAVGSTSEDVFEDPHGTDHRLDAVLARAYEMVPALRQARVVERWAGLRPRAIDRDPMVGPHPDHPAVIALTGGFKVSFGLAHRLADAALDAMAGEKPSLPPSFTMQNHLRAAAGITSL